jgi:hypothetical protein
MAHQSKKFMFIKSDEISLRPNKISTQLYNGCRFSNSTVNKNANTLLSEFYVENLDEKSFYSMYLIYEMFRHLNSKNYNVSNDIKNLCQGKRLLKSQCDTKLEMLFKKYKYSINKEISDKIQDYLEELKKSDNDSDDDTNDNTNVYEVDNIEKSEDNWDIHTDGNVKDDFDWDAFHKDIRLTEYSPRNSEEDYDSNEENN